MSRALSKLFAGGTMLVLASSSVYAAEPVVEEHQRNGVRVRDEEANDGGASKVTVIQRIPQRRKSPAPTYSYWDIGWTDSQFCRQRRTTTNEAVARGLGPSSGWISQLPDCTPAAVSSPAEVADGLARSFWDVRVLPSPVVKVVPDYAITGKPVYLQIDGPRDQAFHVDNPIGDDVAIAATSRYLVDWGDGTTETTTSQGGPWPNGDVTHTYTVSAPALKITVTQLWSAAWSAGHAGGELGDLRTTSTLPLPVTQLQAVRNR